MRNSEKLKPVSGYWFTIKQGVRGLIREPAFYIYLIAVAIYLPWFLPNLRDIAPWDETYYLISGVNLLGGQMRVLADSPLYSWFAALTILPFRSSPFWLIHANSLGRFLLFSFVFLGTWQVAKALKDLFNPVILFGFVFLTPLLMQNFEYPADPMFAALSAIGFSQAVYFVKSKQIKHLWWASFWMGLGMLTRGDAMIIIAGLTVFVIWIGWKHHAWWRLAMAALVPFMTLTYGYVLLRGAVHGNFETGISDRSYVAFEQGQEVDLPEGEARFGAPTESYYVARELFGTPEENNHSVFRAIARNPQAYSRRLVNVLRSLPGLFLTAYFRRYTIFIALLAFRGLVALVQQKKLPLAVLHLIWMLPLSAGIARTLVRVGYFRVFFFALFSLAIIGLKALLDNLNKNNECLIWGGVLGSILILGLWQGEGAIMLSMIVFLSWLILTLLMSKRTDDLPHWQTHSMLLLFAAALLLHGPFMTYSPRVLGESPQEAASLALREVTEPDDFVLTCTPSVVFLAERNVANFCAPDIPHFENSTDFIIWMAAQDFKAIYLDATSPRFLLDISLEQSGQALTQVYAAQGNQIFLLDYDG